MLSCVAHSLQGRRGPQLSVGFIVVSRNQYTATRHMLLHIISAETIRTPNETLRAHVQTDNLRGD